MIRKFEVLNGLILKLIACRAMVNGIIPQLVVVFSCYFTIAIPYTHEKKPTSPALAFNGGSY